MLLGLAVGPAENGDSMTPLEPRVPGEGRNPADLDIPRDDGAWLSDVGSPGGEESVPCPYGLRVNG